MRLENPLGKSHFEVFLQTAKKQVGHSVRCAVSKEDQLVKDKVSKVVAFWTHLLVSTAALEISSIFRKDILDTAKLLAFAFLATLHPLI